MLSGYSRVSARAPEPYLKIDALREAGCARIFKETASDAKRDLPELVAAYDNMGRGETLVDWKVDRLVRSTRPLLETGGFGAAWRGQEQGISPG